MEETNQLMESKEDGQIRAFRARWIVPISHPPIQDGIIIINQDKIIEVDQVENIQREASETIDLGNSVIFPGFVNVHTHLEHANPPTRPTDYYSNLRNIRDINRDTESAAKIETTKQNIESIYKFGTIALADFSTDGASFDPLLASPLFARIFYEISGFKDADAVPIFRKYQNLIKEGIVNKRITKHLAPSSPWALSQNLLKEIGIYERHIAVHMDMTEDENTFILNGSGKIKQFLLSIEDFDYGWQAPGMDALKYFFNYHFYAKHNILIHMNNVDEADIEALKTFPAKVNICVCPRMNRDLNLRRAPIQMFQEKGVNVCLGTEGLSVVADLDIRKEIAYCVDELGLSPESTVKYATLNGAYAIGFHKEVGSLETGKTAKCCVLEADGEKSSDPYELIAKSVKPIAWLDEIGSGQKS